MTATLSNPHQEPIPVRIPMGTRTGGDGSRWMVHALDDWLTAERELLKPVLLDVKEADGQFVVQAEVPGFEAKDLHVQVEGPRLVIEGKTDSEAEKKERSTVYNERKAQQIYRMIDLPLPILAEKAQGQLKNGILTLRLPKATHAKKVKGV